MSTATTTANTSNSPTRQTINHHNWQRKLVQEKTAEFLSQSDLSLLLHVLIFLFPLFNGVISWSASNLKSNHKYLFMVGTKNGRPCFSGLLSICLSPSLHYPINLNKIFNHKKKRKKKNTSCNLLLKISNAY